MKLNEWKDCEQISVIYGICNDNTHKWYIGSCRDLKDRMRRHYYNLIHNTHHSDKLQRSWIKYGESVFNVVILKVISQKELDKIFQIEESFINLFDSVQNGYNMTNKCNVCKPFKLSTEQSKKAGTTHAKAIYAIDRYTGQIVKRYDSIQQAADELHSSTSNISQVCKGRHRLCKNFVFVYVDDYDVQHDYRVLFHHMYQIPKSEDWKQKARLHNKRAKITYKYDLTGNLVATYISRTEAERQNKLPKEYLRNRLDIPINGFVYTHKIKDIV